MVKSRWKVEFLFKYCNSVQFLIYFIWSLVFVPHTCGLLYFPEKLYGLLLYFLFSIRFHFSITDIKNIIESTVVTY